MLEERSQALETEFSFPACMVLGNSQKCFSLCFLVNVGLGCLTFLEGCCKGQQGGAEEMAMCEGVLIVEA